MDKALLAILLESILIATVCAVIRLMFIEKTVGGSWKTFIGGALFGGIIGYLMGLVPDVNSYHKYTGHIWRAYSAFLGIFGKEILMLVQTIVIEGGAIFVTLLLEWGKGKLKAAAEAFKAFKNFKNDPPNNQ